MSRDRLRTALAPLVCTLAVAACTGGTPHAGFDSGAGADAAAPLDSTEWVLTSLEGAPPVAGSRVTLRFEGGSVGGYGGCNWYGARDTAPSAALRLGAVESTARGCTLPAGVAEQEARYYRALGRVASYRRVADRLELADSLRAPVMAFSRRVPAPMRPEQLVGTSWRLRSFGGSPPLTLRFTAGGAIGGFAGCRDYTGSYQARGDELRVTSLAMASTECGAGEAALRREGQFTTDLSEASTYRLDGDSLELTTAPGRRLVFVAQR